MHTMVLMPFFTKFWVMPRCTPISSWHLVLSCLLEANPTSVPLHNFSNSTQSMMSALHCVYVYPSFWFLMMTMAIFDHTMLHYKISSQTATEEEAASLTLSSAMDLLWMAAFS